MDQTNYVGGPVPGFKDAAGQIVHEGDWVVTAVGNGGLRLARVLTIEPRTRQYVARYEPKPREEWSEWERRYADQRPPTKAVYEEQVYAFVQVTQYPDMAPKTKPIRRDLTVSASLKYTGTVPFDMA